MLWIILILWFVFAITCAVFEEKTERGLFGFLLLLSIPIMFYIPLFLK